MEWKIEVWEDKFTAVRCRMLVLTDLAHINARSDRHTDQFIQPIPGMQDGRRLTNQSAKELKKEIKRMRNKEAARRSRDRRKATMAELEGINALLQEQVERANTRLRRMRHEINDLSECNGELRRAAAARESATFLALIEAVGSRENAEALVRGAEGRSGGAGTFSSAKSGAGLDG